MFSSRHPNMKLLDPDWPLSQLKSSMVCRPSENFTSSTHPRGQPFRTNSFCSGSASSIPLLRPRGPPSSLRSRLGHTPSRPKRPPPPLPTKTESNPSPCPFLAEQSLTPRTPERRLQRRLFGRSSPHPPHRSTQRLFSHPLIARDPWGVIR